MAENHFRELEQVFSKYREVKYETRVRWRDNAIVIYANPESLWTYLVFLAFLLAIPILVLYEEVSPSGVFVSVFWLVMFLPLFYNLTKGDMEAAFEQNTGVVVVKSISPIVIFFKEKLHLPVRYRWEGRHVLTEFERVEVREKQYGKSYSNRGFRLYLVPSQGKAVPFAEFRSRQLAWDVAAVVRKMAGMEPIPTQ